MNYKTLLLTTAVISAAAATPAFAQDTQDEANSNDIDIVVIGSRSQANRTALQTAVPVDVFDIGDLTATGRTELNQVLAATVPSFNFNQTAINDGSDIVRPATLRGLGPDQTLVLINGKRRHTSALLNLNAGGRGSAAVDLNAIPSSAIGSVQVLRDGASAQYGSDAIAGVINIVLRDDSSGGGVNAQYGAHVTDIPVDGRGSTTDGETLLLSAWKGFSLGDDGFLTISAEYKDRSTLNRAGLDPRQQYADPNDPREASFDRLNHIYGAAPSEDFSVFANAGIAVSETAEIYAFAGFQDRTGRSPGFYRRSQDGRNVTEIYPDGFLPTIKGDLTDFSLGGGVRGDISEWQYDVSAVYGSNKLDYSVVNSLNTSLGAASPTEFDAGALKFDQLTLNAELVRQFGTVSVAFGAEYRDETYTITAGEPASYEGGGSQVFPGFTPQSAIKDGRDTVGAFIDVEWQPVDQLLIAGALRYESYSDFGDILTGKVSGRYDFSDSFAIRGALSTGFRAPSVHQQFFTSTATVFIDGVPNETGTFPAGSPVASALGSDSLEPEESVNYSLGFVFQGDSGVYATVDAYRIDIDDRIVLTENLGGAGQPEVLQVFADNGITGVNRARFFINGVDTETQGLDIVLGYKDDISLGRLDLSAALNLTETDVTRVPTNDAIPGLTLFSDSNTISFEQGAPTNKIVLNANLTTDAGHSFNLRGTNYGKVTVGSNNPDNVYDLGSKFIVDLAANFAVTDEFSVGIGADNVFDTYPTPPSEAASGTFTGGIFPFSTRSPFGIAGRFLYAKASYTF